MNELTLCQGCGFARFELTREPGAPKRYEWKPVPSCFRPKPGITINNAECPRCEQRRIRNN